MVPGYRGLIPTPGSIETIGGYVMANYKTGAERYNDRMDKIWKEARATQKVKAWLDTTMWANSLTFPQYSRLLKIAIPFTDEQRKRFDAMTDDDLLAALAVVNP
jgi:hypothetical protein